MDGRDVAPGSALWAGVQDLFAEYAECLDDDRLEEWPELFVEDCLYLVIPRENEERGLPLAVVRCESRGFLRDRVVAVRDTAMYTPRYQRHVIGTARVSPQAGPGQVSARADYAVFQCFTDELPQVFSTGVYRALVDVSGDRLRFAELRCVYDSTLVPNSIVRPL